MKPSQSKKTQALSRVVRRVRDLYAYTSCNQEAVYLGAALGAQAFARALRKDASSEVQAAIDAELQRWPEVKNLDGRPV